MTRTRACRLTAHAITVWLCMWGAVAKKVRVTTTVASKPDRIQQRAHHQNCVAVRVGCGSNERGRKRVCRSCINLLRRGHLLQRTRHHPLPDDRAGQQTSGGGRGPRASSRASRRACRALQALVDSAGSVDSIPLRSPRCARRAHDKNIVFRINMKQKT
jgi:hypothetical protein